MRSTAYISGAVDALAKAGAVSPAFAAGAASVLEKAADYYEGVADYKKEHGGSLAGITPDDAVRAVNDGRPWYTGMWRRSGDYLGNRIRKLLHYVVPGGNAMTSADYDAELQDRRNRFLRDYVAKLREEHALDSEIEAALQDKFVGDSSKGYLAAKHKLHPIQLAEEYGTEQEYTDKFRNKYGTSAMRGRLYEPKYDIKSITPAKAPATVLDDPRAHMYGDRGRAVFLSQPRQGLGEY